MELTGKITGISTNRITNATELTLDINEDARLTEGYDDLKDVELLDIVIKKHRKHRSLEANAYHYALCTQIARVLDVSVAFVHNKLLRQCRYFEEIGGQTVCVTLPDSEEVENQVLEAETYHLARTSDVRVGKDGQLYRTYVMLRGSHDFNTQEMSHLIDRTIAEAKELGIETLTPDQQKEMLASYEQHYAKRSK